jgi:hypothetical protein
MNERKEKEKQLFFVVLLHQYEKENRHHLGIFIPTDVINIYIMIKCKFPAYIF